MPTLTIQPCDLDAMLWEEYPDTPRGDYHYIQIRPYGSQLKRGLLKFDFSALPVGAVISAATLSLYFYLEVNNAQGRTCWAYELTQGEWVELEATWNSYKTGSAWAAAGGDYTTVNGASALVPADYGWMDWNVLALVQHFQTEHAEIAHFLLKDGSEDSSVFTYEFHSREEGVESPTTTPKLVIQYEAPAVNPYSYIF